METMQPIRADDSEIETAEESPRVGDEALADVRTLCLRLLAADYRRIPESDREDLAQEIVIDFWRRRETIRHPLAWTYIAARHRAVSWLRARRPSEPPPGRSDPAAVHADAAGDGPEAAIRTLFFTLEAGCRRILARLYIGGWSIRRLAYATREDPRQISRLRARCLKALRSRWVGAGGAAPPEAP